MNKRKEETKLAWKGSGDQAINKIWFYLKDKIFLASLINEF